MSAIAEKICIEALNRPRDARAGLAQRLLTSLEGEDFAAEKAEEALRRAEAAIWEKPLHETLKTL